MNSDEGGNDYTGPIIVPDGPIIIPLLQEEPPPRSIAIFNTIAADISSEYKAKAHLCYLLVCGCCGYSSGNKKTLVVDNNDEELGNNNNNKKKKSEHYRKARCEFVCFICCYGLVTVVALTVTFFVFLLPSIGNESKWTRGTTVTKCNQTAYSD